MTAEERRTSRWKSLFAACGIVAIGFLGSAVLIYTSPKTERVEERRPPRVVQTMKVKPGTERIAITAYGVVVPARELTVQPEVRGLVASQHEALVQGGFIPAGAELFRIDPSDYDLALEEKEAALEEAEFELAVERGRQVVASREWRLLQGDVPEGDTNRSLVLREPHLKRAQALVLRAENQIRKARLDLSRTTVTAPFNVMVLNEKVEIGQLVEPGTEVCTLVGSDEFWVRASVSLDQLRWIRFPSGNTPGASAKVFLDAGGGGNAGREGRVVRLLSDLVAEGRMARVLISVPDPLDLGDERHALPLLLGSFVRVEIDAGQLENVLAIPRSALRDGANIWVVGPERLLDIRPATVLWARKETLFVAPDCLGPGEELVTSGLRIALPRMKVAPRSVAAPAAGEDSGPGARQNDG